jgi:hypothetical protein
MVRPLSLQWWKKINNLLTNSLPPFIQQKQSMAYADLLTFFLAARNCCGALP